MSGEGERGDAGGRSGGAGVPDFEKAVGGTRGEGRRLRGGEVGSVDAGGVCGDREDGSGAVGSPLCEGIGARGEKRRGGGEREGGRTSLMVQSQLPVQNSSFWILFQSTLNTSRVCSCHFRIGKSCERLAPSAGVPRVAIGAHVQHDVPELHAPISRGCSELVLMHF